jgi:hypothetical protein
VQPDRSLGGAIAAAYDGVRAAPRLAHQSRSTIWTAAAIGIASSAPRTPSSDAPANTPRMVTSGLTLTRGHRRAAGRGSSRSAGRGSRRRARRSSRWGSRRSGSLAPRRSHRSSPAPREARRAEVQARPRPQARDDRLVTSTPRPPTPARRSWPSGRFAPHAVAAARPRRRDAPRLLGHRPARSRTSHRCTAQVSVTRRKRRRAITDFARLLNVDPPVNRSTAPLRVEPPARPPRTSGSQHRRPAQGQRRPRDQTSHRAASCHPPRAGAREHAIVGRTSGQRTEPRGTATSTRAPSGSPTTSERCSTMSQAGSEPHLLLLTVSTEQLEG